MPATGTFHGAFGPYGRAIFPGGAVVVEPVGAVVVEPVGAVVVEPVGAVVPAGDSPLSLPSWEAAPHASIASGPPAIRAIVATRLHSGVLIFTMGLVCGVTVGLEGDSKATLYTLEGAQNDVVLQRLLPPGADHSTGAGARRAEPNPRSRTRSHFDGVDAALVEPPVPEPMRASSRPVFASAASIVPSMP
jgi:hypothetical protein